MTANVTKRQVPSPAEWHLKLLRGLFDFRINRLGRVGIEPQPNPIALEAFRAASQLSRNRGEKPGALLWRALGLFAL